MLRIAICDDEEDFLLYEKQLLIKYMECRQLEYRIDPFHSGRSLIEKGEGIKQYHIIFLDIRMEELDGLETARQIRQFSTDTYLVFVTAFMNYALEGYKVKAVRFLLKEKEKLEFSLQECLDAVLRELDQRIWRHEFEFLEGTLVLGIEELLYVESHLHKLLFYIKGKQELRCSMYEKLDTIEMLLKHQDFCRIHQSYLVNLRYIKKMERYQAELYNGTVI